LSKPLQLGRLGYYHYTTPAQPHIPRGFCGVWQIGGAEVDALGKTLLASETLFTALTFGGAAASVPVKTGFIGVFLLWKYFLGGA